MRRRRLWRRSGHGFIPVPNVKLLDVVWFFGSVLVVVGVPVLVVARVLVSLARRFLPGACSVEENSIDAPLSDVEGSGPSAQEFEIQEVETGAAEGRCPVCATNLAEEETVSCPCCATVHHRDCWEFNGACAVFGCVVRRSLTTDSSLAFSSLSPPSPLEAPASDEAVADFLVLRRRFSRWFWLMRLRWWSLLLLSSVGAAGFLVYGLGLGSLGTDAFVEVGLYPLIATAVLSLLSRAARYRLESSLERPPLVPPGRMTALLRRVEHSRSMPLLSRAVQEAPSVYAVLGVFVVLKHTVDGGDLGGLWELLCACLAVLWGGAFVWLAVWSTVRHRAALELGRSRLRGARGG